MNEKIVENNEVQRIPTRICGLDNLLHSILIGMHAIIMIIIHTKIS